MRSFLLWFVFFISSAAPALAEVPNLVDWGGVSHLPWQDRRPLCPVGGESFQVRFQTLENDVVSARVQVTDGSTTWVAASVVNSRGPYDIWGAQISATAASTLSYFIELTDGTDVDYLSVSGLSDGVPTDGGFVLDFTTLAHAPVGATLLAGGGAVFKVWAPTRSSAHVRGDFNGWGTANPMYKNGPFFITQIPAAADRQQYKYFFNNSDWNFDARGRSHDPSNNYNSYIEDSFRYTWPSMDFPTPALESLVIYQLHIGTFAGRNDPAGPAPSPSRYTDVAARVSHLADLGVNAVMINPITEFPGDLSAGYNPITQWAPEWKYGTPDEFKLMVDAFHSAGIAVLMDIVWNHFTTNDNFMWFYDGSQTYFDTPHVDTPWGAQADFDEAEVVSYYLDSAHYWLEEFDLDGFRMDATDFMNIAPQEAAGWALMQTLNDEIDRRWRDKIVIAEQLPDDSWVTRPTALGGAGFDSQYFDRFTDDVRAELFDGLTGNPEMGKVRAAVLGGGTDLEGPKVTNYIELHDEAWPTSGGSRLAKIFDPTFPHDDAQAKGRLKLGQGLVLFAPGVPAFLQGNEWLEDTDFGTDTANKIDWSKKSTNAGIVEFFRDAIALRVGTEALHADAGVSVFQTNDGANVIAFRRFDTSGNEIVVVANFSNNNYTNYRVGFPNPDSWEELLNSEASAYGGTGSTNPGTLTPDPVAIDGYPQSLALAVPARSLAVFSNESGTIGIPDASGGGGAAPVLRALVPNPTRGATRIHFTLSESATPSITIYDLRGRLVRELNSGSLSAGDHSRDWDGRDLRGRLTPPGVYFIRVQAGSLSAARKLVRTGP